MGRKDKKLEHTFESVLRALERKSQLSESEIKKDTRLEEMLKESKDSVRDYILSVFAEQLSEADKKTLKYVVESSDDPILGGDEDDLGDTEDTIAQEETLTEEEDEDSLDELVQKILNTVDAEEAKALIDDASGEGDADAGADDMDFGSDVDEFEGDDEAEFESTDDSDESFVSGDEMGDVPPLEEDSFDYESLFADGDDDVEGDDDSEDDLEDLSDEDDFDGDTDEDEDFDADEIVSDEDDDEDDSSESDEDEDGDEDFDPEDDFMDEEDFTE